ncbi:restriction endonuclease subunit S [Moritella sp.]|uniref:restriction endonuclease subunit S n=1 Tax=Moritella sp. TaxID=78556 RepID=UPI001D775C3F|nr:restriction endonuclease subunit S [Moritella sp.]MCJ8349183.1 restriction endonuclease subunit S [Moritella sp.]NQZ39471.1 restriction endonuclease subunit S [Moritella sp.]
MAESKYQAYPEYKDSGVEWLGDVPRDWSIKRLKYICSVQTGTKDTVNAIDNGKYPFFVRSQTVERINSVGSDCEAVLTAGDGVGVGKVYHYYKGKFDYHQRVYMLSEFNLVTGRFVYYYLSSNFYKVALAGNAKSTVDSLRLPQFLNFEFSLPLLIEQEIIVNFLDHETAKIDTLIDKQQQLIKLLKEKRQAVISHAVTKGLNPQAPMKDSGVKWLGDVPEHWDVLQIRRILKLMEQGKSPECENRVSEYNEWGVLKTSCVNNAEYDYSQNKALPNFITPFPAYEVKIGDVLMSRASGSINLIGSVAYVYETPPKILLSDKIFRLHLTPQINGEFFSLLMRSSYMRRNIERTISGAEGMANNITKSAVIGFRFSLPPKSEQNNIVEFVMQQLELFNCLVKKAQDAIALMQERRTALISAAVTGKIDVRDWS